VDDVIANFDRRGRTHRGLTDGTDRSAEGRRQKAEGRRQKAEREIPVHKGFSLG
jgi:hypothetical protein